MLEILTKSLLQLRSLGVPHDQRDKWLPLKMLYWVVIYEGNDFTWKDVRNGLVKCQLDRVVTNFGWCDRFLSAKVFHFSPTRSDHLPLLVVFGNGSTRRKRKERFSFEKC